MGSIFFFIKTFIITLVVVFLMQIRIGTSTLEEHAMFFIHDSPMVEPLQEVAEGTTALIRDVLNSLTKNINTDFSRSLRSENIPGSRELKFQFDRSREFVARNARKAANAVKETVDEKADDISGKSEEKESRSERVKNAINNLFDN